MFGLQLVGKRFPKEATRRHTRPNLEGLEDRLLLYSALGDQWTYTSRITYSFMPDGTSIGGVSSVLFQTLNRVAQTATWQQQIEQGAALWENVTGVNLALVPDGGQAVGSAGNQQDDARFGDIRIGAVPLPAGVLAETFLPPPANGGTLAGDIVFNSTVNWQINSNYDVMTLAAHEFGHALGLGESSVSTAVMYGTYNGIKQALASDDIAGIQSIYGTRPFDQFNSNGQRNNTFMSATNINSYLTGSAQIAIPGLDITTSGQFEWFAATVPGSGTGTMAVTVQSSNLSSLAPKLQVYTSSLGLVGTAAAPGTLGATISISVANVQPGQQYYYKVFAAGGAGPIGGYGLLVNFGSQAQPPIQPPNTVVPQQPDQGGGTINNTASDVALTSIGSLTDWAIVTSASAQAPPPAPGGSPAGPGSGGGGSVVTAISAALMPPGASGTLAASTVTKATAVPAVAPAAMGPALLVEQALEQWTSTKNTKHAFGFSS
jgi:hypothetical protein